MTCVNVKRNRDENEVEEIVNYDNNNNTNITYDNIMPKHDIGIKTRETILTSGKMRSLINHFKFFMLRK